MGDNNNGFEIAIIGLSLNFPGANNVDEFWDLLKNGREGITFLSKEEMLEMGINPDSEENKNFVGAGAFIENKEFFDSAFFRYTPDEARAMDPQIRLFHECVWHALEDGGIVPDNEDLLIGLFSGSANSFNWQVNNKLEKFSLDDFTANTLGQNNSISSLIAYKLNLKGPVEYIHTACSTSLVAVHRACQSLNAGECDVAVAGATSMNTTSAKGYSYKEGGFLSPDGKCRSFDRDANGTIGGEGCGAIVLKRLEDAILDKDNIYAIIKGSSINNDGSRKVGYVAPSVKGQLDVIRMALNVAEVEPTSITYIETHGTATKLGDSVEVEALKLAYPSSKIKNYGIGSVKSNIGHLDTAAGIAGLIKVVLALKNKQIPPSLNYNSSNPDIDYIDSPFYVNTELKRWERNGENPLRAGLSGFGIGGTNAHLILEEAAETNEKSVTKRNYKPILFSAKSKKSLSDLVSNTIQVSVDKPQTSIEDMSYSLMMGRSHLEYREGFIVNSLNELEDIHLSRDVIASEKRPIIFTFPGQGCQFVNMGIELYNSLEEFRYYVDLGLGIYKKIHHVDLKPFLFNTNVVDGVKSEIDNTVYTQPIVFIFEYSLAKSLIEWGIEPDYMIGHSLGEYAAGCISGVFSFEDGIKIVSKRAELMNQVERGSMVSVVDIDENEVRAICNEGITIAAINSSTQTVVAGNNDSIEEFIETLIEKKIIHKKLNISHAFHSDMVIPILIEFEKSFNNITLNPPKIPFISSIHGNFVGNEEATSPSYWKEHINKCVRFKDGVNTLMNTTDKALFIETGPGRVLSELINIAIVNRKSYSCINMIKNPMELGSEEKYFWKSMCKIWKRGGNLKWSKYYQNDSLRKISLPHYPFERKEYPHIANPYAKIGELISNSKWSKAVGIDDWFISPSWKQSQLLKNTIGIPKSRTIVLFINKDNALHEKLFQKIYRENHKVVRVYLSSKYTFEGENKYHISSNKFDYSKLFADFKKRNIVPDHLIYLWTGDKETCNINSSEFYADFRTEYYNILNIARFISHNNLNNDIKLSIITNELFEINGAENLFPLKSAVMGALKVIPLEYQNIKCHNIDISDATSNDNYDLLISQIYAEVFSESEDIVIAFRNSIRWKQTFERIKLGSVDKKSHKFKENGVYLITGGFGGMGLTFAKYLATEFKAKLILLGRTFIPEREQWDDWLRKHDEENSSVKRIVEIMELEKAGAQVIALGLDIADYDKMKDLKKEVDEKFGKVDGIIHTAGVIDYGGIIQNRDDKDDVTVLNPKIMGTLILDELFVSQELDFFVLCSSIGNIYYSIKFGQVAYNTGNEFLDFFAYYKRKQGIPCVSINWGDWSQVGMGLVAMKYKGMNESEMKKASEKWIKPENGVDVLVRVLNQDLPRVIITEFGSDYFFTWIRSNKINSPQVQELSEVKDIKEEYVADISGGSNSNLERLLQGIWIEFFGKDNISVDDDFLEIGGDSLKAMTLSGLVSKKLNFKLPLFEILDRRTIKYLAAYISESKAEQNFDGRELSAKSDDSKNELSITRDQMLSESILTLCNLGVKKLFCFPPTISYGYIYSNMSKMLNDYTTYGINFKLTESPVNDLVDNILKINTNGPYNFIAYSAGGVLSVLVAKELENRGKKVDNIILIDCYWRDIKNNGGDKMKMLENLEKDGFAKNVDNAAEAFGLNYAKDEILKNAVDYLFFLNNNKQIFKLNSNLHLIKCEQYPVVDDFISWSTFTYRTYIEYEGVGSHGNMLTVGNTLNKNVEIINNILLKN